MSTKCHRARRGTPLVRAAGVLGLAVLIASCESVGPSDLTYGPVRTALRLEPAIVRPGEQFTVRVELINQSDEPIVLATGMSCPFYVAVRPGGNPLNGPFPGEGFPGAGYPCLAIGSSITIPARGRYVGGPVVTANVPPGDFVVEIDWTISQPPFRPLAAKLKVRP